MSTSPTSTTPAPQPPGVAASNGHPAARGNAPLGMPRPSGRRRRRPALIGLAVLLIVGSAAVAGLLALRLDTRVPALVAARPIAIGQQITKEDLGEQRIAGDGLTVLGADQSAKVIGSFAAQDIPQGRLIDAQMVQSQGFLKTGTVAVGVSVPAGRMPASGLRPGDRVQVVQVLEGQATVLVDEATVSSAPSQSSGSSGGGSLFGGPVASGDTSGTAIATLIVSPSDAPKVAAASAANRVAIILITRGSTLTTS
jgi:hypothetical protein